MTFGHDAFTHSFIAAPADNFATEGDIPIECPEGQVGVFNFTIDQWECKPNPSSVTSEEEEDEINGDTGDDDDDSNDDIECKTSDCPPDHVAIKTTDAFGNPTCSCQSTVAIGEGLGAVGKGIGMLALGGIAVTGIVIYGVYRIIRG